MAKATDEDLSKAIDRVLNSKNMRQVATNLNKAVKVAKRLPKSPPPDTPLNIAAKKRLEQIRKERSWTKS